VTTVRECDYPWTGFMIWSNGSACCCCYGSTGVGNVSKASPEAVWNNPTMESLRASLSAGVVHTVCRSGTCKYVVGSRASEDPSPDKVAVPRDFDNAWYVAQYFDVRDGIGRGFWSSGRDHYSRFGHREFRCRNAAEWNRRTAEQQQRVIQIGTGYSATLSWLDASRVDEHTLAVNFAAANSGSIVWQPKGLGSTPIQTSAESYRRLEDVQRVMPMYAYRGDLPKSVEPGQSIAVEMKIPLNDLPIGRSFVVVDLVCDEKAVRLASGVARPIVLGVYRDGTTDALDLVTG
jgi:hypothetical protein